MGSSRRRPCVMDTSRGTGHGSVIVIVIGGSGGSGGVVVVVVVMVVGPQVLTSHHVTSVFYDVITCWNH